MFFDRDRKKEPDFESKRIWDLFKKTEEQWCCKVTQEAVKGGVQFMNFVFPSGEVVSMKINYCIRCGRKLESGFPPTRE